ncbi:serine/threonine-protein kinase [Planococcus lenghuensis]|uniref:Serine/threonine protein kinase n=1 Tax=Planococcus lenghuensis TaxID=2213202 RepID=A0A1Q2L2Y6_9BACL|nr:serine/threonine protein kinase [Planococcus lenghuensis]AQQ54776.1 serine/threonine protein kinase [Planococcus lenghuensis]
MKAPYTIRMNRISFQLKEWHDFSWLQKAGEVFCVFAEQDSGNVSFGVESEQGRKFIKYAGVKPINYPGDPADAIERLKASVPLYEELAHPNLVQLTAQFSTAEGYALVFDWFDGENLYAGGSLSSAFMKEGTEPPFHRFRRLPVNERLTALENIFEFHVYAEQKGFVAVDFYDGSILYDFAAGSTKICDIDLYRKKPFVNPMGKLWGSSRFMSPEEFELGAEIDGRTNVFNMGATAFCLIGGGRDRSLAEWEAGQALHQVAMRAVETDKRARYATVKEFAAAWETAAEKWRRLP